MLSVEQFLSFLLAAGVLTVAPGPDNLMVLSIGMTKGKQSGILFGLGCALGCLSHTLLAVIGVSALIATSTQAFIAFKLCGGLYLAWLGMNTLRHAEPTYVTTASHDSPTPRRLFLLGVLANAINPKVILFFLSFLPQFVVPGHGSINAQMAWLGIIFTAQAAFIFGLLGYFSGAIGQWLNAHSRLGATMTRLTGVLFIGLGFRLILNE